VFPQLAPLFILGYHYIASNEKLVMSEINKNLIPLQHIALFKTTLE